MSDRMVVTDPNAIRAFTNALRVRILDALQDAGSASASQLARVLGESASKIDYHLKLLEKYGLIRLAEVRPRGNLHERIYTTAADEILIQRPVGQSGTAGLNEATTTAVRHVVSMIADDVMEIMGADESVKGSSVQVASHHLTREEVAQVNGEIAEILRRFEDRKPGPGLVHCHLAFILAVKPEGKK